MKKGYYLEVMNEGQAFYYKGGWKSKAEAIGKARYLVETLSEVQWDATISARVYDAAGNVVKEVLDEKALGRHGGRKSAFGA